MARIVSGEAFEDDTEERIQDRALRPQTFDDFVGQAPLKANLKVFVAAAAARREALDHVLCYGPPGLGKRKSSIRRWKTMCST